MKGYKGFNLDMTCRGFRYEVGQVYETDKPIALCTHGFHFCKELLSCSRYYELCEFSRFAEVEALGEVIEGEDKCVTNKIKIVRELSWLEIFNTLNCGGWNFGHGNTGNCNTGNNNTGGYNTGSFNSGPYNAGAWNTGGYNTGGSNSGWYNTGHNNAGDRNTGVYNLGSCNTGDFNISNNNTGCFMTEDMCIPFFNKPSNITLREWRSSHAKFLLYASMPSDLSKRQAWWDHLSKIDKKAILNIPNFDPDIFKQCTAIDVKGGTEHDQN